MNIGRSIASLVVSVVVGACSGERPVFGTPVSTDSSTDARGDAGTDGGTLETTDGLSPELGDGGSGTGESSTDTTSSLTPGSEDDGTGADSGGQTSTELDASGAEEGCPTAGCDDGLACNGVETCVDDRCESGEPPCSAEPACSALCQESNIGGECSQQAEDADGDGEGSAQCAASPGLDCNDNDDSIFSTAVEICDGIDQDCDGLEDIDEGFDLTGEVVELPVGSGGISGAWSPELGTFAVAEWFSSGAHFRTVSLSGEASESIALEGVGGVGFRGELTSGHGRFALGVPQDFGQFNVIDATGLLELEQPAPLWSTDGGVRDVAVVATETGWLALFTLNTETSAPQGRRFTAAGEPLEPSALTVGDLTDTPDGIEAAVRGDEVGIVWDSADGVYFSRYSDDLIKLESRSLNPTGRSSDIAAGSSGYAVAWFETDFSLMFMQLNAEGEVVCGPTDMGISLELNQQPHLSVAAYAGGYAVLYSDNASTRVHLLRVHEGCDGQLPPETVQQPSQSNKNDIRLSGDASGLIATWRDGPADPRYRILGGALCNLPQP